MARFAAMTSPCFLSSGFAAMAKVWRTAMLSGILPVVLSVLDGAVTTATASLP